MGQRAVVVGASSGIGAAVVRRLVGEGYRVAAVARRQELLHALRDELDPTGQRVLPVVHDVVDTGTVRAAFDRIREELGGIDLIVYSAGVMPDVGEAEFNPDTDRHIVEVNVIGAMNWLDLAAAHFREQGHGVLVGIGSVAGDRGRYGNTAYGASKAALHTYLESLRHRLASHGVTVITIKPGPVHTPMTEHLDRKPMAIQADAAADGIFRAIARRREVAYVPGQWALIMAIIRCIPSVLFRRTRI